MSNAAIYKTWLSIEDTIAFLTGELGFNVTLRDMYALSSERQFPLCLKVFPDQSLAEPPKRRWEIENFSVAERTSVLGHRKEYYLEGWVTDSKKVHGGIFIIPMRIIDDLSFYFHQLSCGENSDFPRLLSYIKYSISNGIKLYHL
ncbi:hypothetical protein [uncultured Microbulbifer sp.]|uniref:hypothetical protein n=1 Tax=uncultured Microbulbifer sp. TaxID=348147 RepID=UPI00260BA120|nr:hypothetical protein [uncultured Microbulbifer sp.]